MLRTNYFIFALLFSFIGIAADIQINHEENGGQALNTQALEKLTKILREEKAKRGSFIKEIKEDLKECTNGKMVELDFLTLKSSYWWDRRAYLGNYASVSNNKKKPLSIDHKFRSSTYSRSEVYNLLPQTLALGGNSWETDKFVNSWNSVRAKLKFFNLSHLPKNQPMPIPKSLEGIVDYGISSDYAAQLDLTPSIFQIIKAIKTDKFATKKPCAIPYQQSGKDISEVILTEIDNILNSEYYGKFLMQNHPLNLIIQDHILKIMYKAMEKQFNENTHSESNRSDLYEKILKNMGGIIELMSVFSIDMDNEICELRNSHDWDEFALDDPYYLYYQLYEIFNDLLFLLMYLDDPYTISDFDRILTQNSVERFPIFAELKNNNAILMASYPMRSGMDAFVNASMAIGHVPEDIAIAAKVNGLENKAYYELGLLAKLYQKNHRTEQNRVFVALKRQLTKEEENLLEDTIFTAVINDKFVDKNKTTPLSVEKINYFLSKKSVNIRKLQAHIQINIANNSDHNFQFLKNLGRKIWIGSSEISLKSELRNFTISEIKKILNVDNLFPIINYNGQYYLEMPGFLMRNLQQNSNLYSLLNDPKNVFDISFDISQITGITTGLTTDSMVISDDIEHVNKLYIKFNHILNIKQVWKDSANRIRICMDVIKETAEVYKKIENLQNNVLNKYLIMLDRFQVNIAHGSAEKIDQIMKDLSLDLKMMFENSGQQFTYDPLKYYAARKNNNTTPWTILWDITMEVDQGPCYSLINKFRDDIESGKIVFILFKSLQKYANLGVGKSKAGVVTLVGKRSPFVEETHNKLMKYGKEAFSHRQEYALMIFFFDRFGKEKQVLFQDNEKIYFQATKKHALKIFNKSLASSDDCFSISAGCLFVSDSYIEFRDSANPLPFADTFGFAIPTKTIIANSPYRFSVGLNPKGLQ